VSYILVYNKYSIVPFYSNIMYSEPIYSLRIYSDKIVKVQERQFFAKTEKSKQAASVNFSKEKLTGQLSLSTCRIIKTKLEIWLSSLILSYYKNSTDKLNKKRLPIFVTLTLSSQQRHSDKDIKRNMLDRFITKLKHNSNVKYLFWRAETQKNGNIHFHLICDAFVEFQVIRKLWNDTQEEHGYIEPFYKKFKHRNPPSIHVKSISDVGNFVKYCVKYATKEAEGRKIEGRLWGMSDEIRNLKPVCADLSQEIWEEIEQAINKNQCKVFTKDYATVYFLRSEINSLSFMPFSSRLLSESYSNNFENLYVKEHDLSMNEINDLNVSEAIDDFFNTSIEFNNQTSFDTSINHFSNDLFSSFTSLYFNNH